MLASTPATAEVSVIITARCTAAETTPPLQTRKHRYIPKENGNNCKNWLHFWFCGGSDRSCNSNSHNDSKSVAVVEQLKNLKVRHEKEIRRPVICKYI